MKKKSSNKLLIINVATVVAAGLMIGCFFLGYNKGQQDAITGMTHDASDLHKTFYGVYKNSYYDTKNRSRETFLVFRENGTCRYIDTWTEHSAKLDFTQDDSYRKCSYIYDRESGTGNLQSWTYWLDENGNEQRNDYGNNINITFKFSDGLLMVGGSTYSKINAAY